MRRPWVDPSLMSLYGSEVAKFSLATDVYVTSKLALWIIGSSAPEIGISNVDFQLYTTGLRQLCSVTADDRYDSLLKRIETFQRAISMLKIDPIECYRKIK
jgi:hypothetical protein